MGMFNDSRQASREGWKYDYKGSDLLPYAQKKLEYYTRRERELREQIAERAKNPAIKTNSAKNTALQNRVGSVGAERERCLVWVHEFTRSPDRTYSLSLGDVTYFDIASIPCEDHDDEEDD